MTIPAELLVVLVAGLMLFLALLRWVVAFLQGFEKKRLEMFDKYEATLTENVQLKGQVTILQAQNADITGHAKYYYKELAKYKNLYEQTLDKKNK